MKHFLLIFLGILGLWLTGCTCQVGEPTEENDDMGNLIAAQIADMTRSAAMGTLAGLPTAIGAQQQPSLQQNNLEPGEYTVQFQAFPPADGLGFAAYAIINWKIAGQQITRKVSVANGVSISGVCEAVDVTLIDVSQTGQFGFPAATPSPNPTGIGLYKIGVALSKGTRPNVQQPATLLTAIAEQAVAPGVNVVNYKVPTDAGVVAVMITAARLSVADVIADNEIAATQLNNSGLVGLSSWYPLQSDRWVPLGVGCTTIGISNYSAGTALTQVFWGIDG
jgi:hypothetical protein